MPSGQPRTPQQLLSDLLTGHPDAESLLNAAGHWRALARASAAWVGRALAAVQAARLHYQQLGHRLDPRHRRPIPFAAAASLLLVLGTELTMLNVIELSRLLGGTRSVLPALAVTGVWLTGAWLVSLASRERRWPLVIAAAGGAVLLGLLLAITHGSGLLPGWPAISGHTAGSSVFGVLAGLFILVLVIGAAVLLAHTEPVPLMAARRSWHRARAAYHTAVHTAKHDAEAAAVATEAWLGLVRAYAGAMAGPDEQLVHDTVALAASLLEGGPPEILPA